MTKIFIIFMLFCLMTIFVIGCTIDEAIEIVTESIIEEPEKPAIEEPAPVVEENKPEDYIMELKPIKQFSNYAVNQTGVFGIDQSKLILVIPEDTKDNLKVFDSFFMKDGKMYFIIKDFVNDDPAVEETHYFEQTGNDIIKIVKSDFPMPRASDHIEFEDGDYKIIKYPYDIDGESTITSRVFQGSLIVGYLKIDGCVLVDDGLWYSVTETIQTRLEGVYYWPVGGQPRRVLDNGRIY